MDDMIRDATDQHHPSYSNTAWDKMELMLDKHLPQKRDRRRFIFFLLLFLLFGGSVFFTGYYFGGNKIATPGAGNQNTAGVKPVAATKAAEQALTSNEDENIQHKDFTSTITPDNKDHATNNEPGKMQKDIASLSFGKAMNNIKIIPGNTIAYENDQTKAVTTNGDQLLPGDNNFINEKVNIAVTDPVNGNKTKYNTATVNTNPSENLTTGQAYTKKTKEQDPIKPNTDPKEKTVVIADKSTSASTVKKKSKPGIGANFGLSFSVGPEISFVGSNKPGKTTLSYGIGLGYTFAKRITLQTGFYVTRKIYSADSANYHPPGQFWSYYPNMQNIEANCKVFEIPVALLYNFRQKGNHNWFAGTAISSYLMKKETYDYEFKTAAGQTNYRSNTITDKNKQYFSVMTLSGGYQYNISKHVSISAEPYFKLPLNGIGFGKVQLKGGGMLFNATVKPFGRKK